MKIEIFGSGCANCTKLEANAREAVKEMGIQAEIVKVNTLDDIVKRGVMSTPALGVDGVVKSSGRVLSVTQVKEILLKN